MELFNGEVVVLGVLGMDLRPGASRVLERPLSPLLILEVISHSLVRFGPGNRFSLYNQVAPNASEALF